MNSPEHEAPISDASLEELLVPYADGELEGVDLARVEAWLAESPRARELLDQHRLIGDRIAGWTVAGWTDAGLETDSDRTIESVRAQVGREKVVRFWRIAVAAAAVALVAALGVRWAIDSDTTTNDRGSGTDEIAQAEPAPELLENLEVLEELTDVLANSSDPTALDDDLVELLLEEVAMLDEPSSDGTGDDGTGDDGTGDDGTDTNPAGAQLIDPSLYDFWLEEEVSGGG